MIECSVNWENGDELPNCFLGRHRLGCPLPCTIRLRTERSDHMAVGENDFSGHHVKRQPLLFCVREGGYRQKSLNRVALSSVYRTALRCPLWVKSRHSG